jgi:lipopolysaccharide export system protein LptA
LTNVKKTENRANCNRYHLRGLLLAVVLFAAAGSATLAQQVRRTQTAEIKAAELIYDWDKSEWEFSGDCKVSIAGGHDAQMTAPRMSVKLSPKLDEIVHLIAYGPVKFHVLTRPNSEGIRYSINASAQKQALYREVEQVIELTGGAEADLVAVGVEGQTARFVGQKITADLKTSRLSVDDANVKIQTPVRN